MDKYCQINTQDTIKVLEIKKKQLIRNEQIIKSNRLIMLLA